LIIAGLLIFFKMTKFQKSGEVVYFEFSGWNWWTYSDTYKIYKSGDNVLFEKLGFDAGYDDEIEPKITVVDSEILSDLTNVVFEDKVNRRDGFDKINKHVLDWTSRHLYITFENGDHLSANGYMRHPNNYSKAKGDLLSIISKYSE
jgi:hypothetical protein